MIRSETNVLDELKNLLSLAVSKGASDLHLTEGSPPILRIDGMLHLTDLARLSRDETKKIVLSLLDERHKAIFEEELEFDFSFEIPDLGRFRVNIHMQRGSVEAAFRIIPSYIKTIEELGLPSVVKDLARKPNGLVLVTGPTGVGKTTTLTSMVDLINSEKRYIIIMIEDPVEYVHKNKRSIIKQREVYSDTKSFPSALRHALRQDPNVIVVGEMRDLETISTTLTAAETGHLVLATLHTPTASQTIDRIIDVFPPHQQHQVRVQLAECLQGVITQELLPRADGKGRIVATEILFATQGVRHLIREQQTSQIPNLIQTGSQYGMKGMDKSLKELCQRGLITEETALSRVRNLDDFKTL